MKVFQPIEDEKKFKPFSIILEIENEKEARLLCYIFKQYDLRDLIRIGVRSQGCDRKERFSVIAENIEFEAREKICRIISENVENPYAE